MEKSSGGHRSEDTDDVGHDEDDSGAYLERESEKEWRQLLQLLESFPNSFQLDTEQLSHTACRDLLQVFQSEAESGFGTPLENARCLNLFSYFLFLSGDSRKALDLTDEVLKLEGEKNNLTALANKAAMLWRSGHRAKAREAIAEAETLKKDTDSFQYLVVKAKAELAYSYSRFGPKYTQPALDMYAEVIAKGKQPELSNWKFGLALNMRRGCNVFSPLLSAKDENKLLKILQLLMEIIEESQSDYLKAICYAEVAVLLQARHGTDIASRLQDESRLTALEACERALGLSTEACSVLWKCGMVYRKNNQLEKSLELLQRAVSKRPTSAQYHQLGETYKALSLQSLQERKIKEEESADDNIKIMKISEIRVHKEESHESFKHEQTVERDRLFLERGSNCAPSLNRDNDIAEDAEPTSIHESLCKQKMPFATSQDESSSPDYDTLGTSVKSYHTDLLKTDETLHKSQSNLNRLARSKSKEETKLSPDNPYIKNAIEALQKAVDLAEGNVNFPAIVSLARLRRDVEDLEGALHLLNGIQVSRGKHIKPFDRIEAYEQAGFVLLTMSQQSERTQEERKRLKEESECKLGMALMLCSRLCNKMPDLQHYIREEWPAFPALLKAVDESDRNQKDKLKEKVKLFQMIRDYRHSVSFLEEIIKMAPDEAQNVEYLRMKIENYVGEKQFEQALAFIAMLSCTAQGIAADKSVSSIDREYVSNVYLMAAEAALMSSENSTACSASEFFKAAYGDFFYGQCESSSMSASSASEDDSLSGNDDNYDLMIVHEESALEQAMALKEFFKDVYGLSVTRMDEDCMPGRFCLDYMARTMTRCRQVVVLAGGKKVGRQLRLLLERAARKRTTVTLLLEGRHVPRLLQSRASMPCPVASILARGGEITQASAFDLQEEDMRAGWVHAVCSLFRFLIGIQLPA